MTDIAIQIAQGILGGWFIVQFPLFAALVELLFHFTRITNEKVKSMVVKPFECYKCAGFWFTLILTQNIWIAIASSFALDMWDKHANFTRL